LCQKSKYSFKMLENAKNSKRSKFVRELRLAMEDQNARGGGGKVDPCTWTSRIDGWTTTPRDDGPTEELPADRAKEQIEKSEREALAG
jgi:hypothetical protein